MLQRKERVETQGGRVEPRRKYAHYPAGFLQLTFARKFGGGRHWTILAHPRTVTVPRYAGVVIDLHTHSNFSDGSDSPSELAAAAGRLGISTIALTDHDTTASHDEMRTACDAEGIALIPGTEISLVDHEFPRRNDRGEEGGRGVHVLAYFVPLDPASPMQLMLERLRTDREDRNGHLLETLRGMGFDRLTMEAVAGAKADGDVIGRPHFAEAMFTLHPEIVGERTPEGWRAIFENWLGVTGRAYLPKTDVTLEEVVATARGSGTVFSVAHPLLNYLPDYTHESIERVMPRVLGSLRERGFTGAEAYYGGTAEPTRALMVKLTRDAGLIPTGGSDYHGTVKNDVALGVGYTGDLHVPDHIVDELRAASSLATAR